MPGKQPRNPVARPQRSGIEFRSERRVTTRIFKRNGKCAAVFEGLGKVRHAVPVCLEFELQPGHEISMKWQVTSSKKVSKQGLDFDGSRGMLRVIVSQMLP